MLCAVLAAAAASSSAADALPPLHATVCGGGRKCRPGEGNPSVTHADNPYPPLPLEPDELRVPPHEPDPKAAHYAAFVTAASAVAQHHRLVIMCAADFDYREIVENWYAALRRSGLSNGIVYAYDAELHDHLRGRGVPSVDGSANLEAWNRTRLARHIQRAEAERHIAAAALAAAGLDVLLMDAAHVMLRDATPTLHAVVKSGDVGMAVARNVCDGKPPVGCHPLWSLVFLRGTGSREQRERAVAWQVKGVTVGLVDFYLRWWNGAHAIGNGFSKLFGGCAPRLENGLSPEEAASNETSAVAVIGLRCDALRIALLPDAFFNTPTLYASSPVAGAGGRPVSLIAKAAKPIGRDRLKLDRYDEQDFSELVAAMRADGLWFL